MQRTEGLWGTETYHELAVTVAVLDCIRKRPIVACACSTQHLVGQQKVVRGLETAVGQEITGLSVPSRLRGRCSICKDVYSDRAVDTNCFGRIPSI